MRIVHHMHVPSATTSTGAGTEALLPGILISLPGMGYEQCANL